MTSCSADRCRRTPLTGVTGTPTAVDADGDESRDGATRLVTPPVAGHVSRPRAPVAARNRLRTICCRGQIAHSKRRPGGTPCSERSSLNVIRDLRAHDEPQLHHKLSLDVTERPQASLSAAARRIAPLRPSDVINCHPSHNSVIRRRRGTTK